MYGRPARPEEDQSRFDYPLFTLLFFWPAVLIGAYDWASAVWMAMLQVCLLALALVSLAWSQWRPPRLLFGLTIFFALLWYHAARTLLLGQFAGVEALLLAGALLAARLGRQAWAGLLLALATSKPQMAVLVIPGLLLWSAWNNRWALIGWFAGGIALLFGLPFVLLPGWLPEWLGQIFGYLVPNGVPGPTAILTGLLLPGVGTWLEYALDATLLAYLAWAWYEARRDTGWRLQWAVALTLVVTNLVAVRTATTNYVMLTPALFLLFAVAQRTWGRRGLALAAAVEVGLLVGLWLLFILTVQNNAEQPIMFLPLPLLLLAGLIVARHVHPALASQPAALKA
jgi:hypothetical protein